jgi:hypothetical protein
MMRHYSYEGTLEDSGEVPTKIYCCTECGCAVITQWQHNQWHEQLESTKRAAASLYPIRGF